jgi:hypothetical protein
MAVVPGVQVEITTHNNIAVPEAPMSRIQNRSKISDHLTSQFPSLPVLRIRDPVDRHK